MKQNLSLKAFIVQALEEKVIYSPASTLNDVSIFVTTKTNCSSMYFELPVDVYNHYFEFATNINVPFRIYVLTALEEIFTY